MQQNTLGNIAYEITNYLGNVNVVISDRKIWTGTPINAFRAVILSKTDYFPFGQEISSRTAVTENYNYGYIGLEKDNEVSGSGNSYNSDYRQYDPRLGRWKSCDPKRHWFPSMSAYCYASNSPIAGKDDNGLYTIFVNGYIYGKPNYVSPSMFGPPSYVSDDILPGKPYWTNLGDGFLKESHKYFGDGFGKYINGSGTWAGSSAQGRQRRGEDLGRKIAQDIIAEIEALNNDRNEDGTLNTQNDVKELNFVTHSMGAAFAEGMISEFMKHEELKKLLENGQIVHFSACDGDKILISEDSKHLNRTQLNFFGDKILRYADPGAIFTGGYRINGIKKFGVVHSTVKQLHPRVTNESKYDFHFDGKSNPKVWDFLRILDSKHGKQKNDRTIVLTPDDLKNQEDGCE